MTVAPLPVVPIAAAHLTASTAAVIAPAAATAGDTLWLPASQAMLFDPSCRLQPLSHVCKLDPTCDSSCMPSTFTFSRHKEPQPFLQ